MQVIVENRGNPTVKEIWNGDEDAVLSCFYIFLAPEEEIDPADLADGWGPARLGWIMVGVPPRVDGTTLYMIQPGVRTYWVDERTDQVHPNKAAVRPFERVWRFISTRLSFPMKIRNVKTGAEGTRRSLGYSAGAEKWVRDGGLLRQEGTANIEYLIPGISPE